MSRRDQLDRVARLSPEARARLLDTLREEAAGQARAQAIEPLPAGAEIPLSAAQRQLWILDRLAPGSAAYNMPLAVAAEGPLSPSALQAALAGVVERHQVLRTVFTLPAEGDQARPVLLTTAEGAPRPSLIDLSGLAAPAADVLARRLSDLEAARPFDLARPPLLRCRLLRLSAPGVAPARHLLLFTLHHIAGDGWSSGLLIDEVARLYRAALAGSADAGAELPELPIQYADYAAWQQRRLAGAGLAGDLAYWRRRLAAAPRRLELPRDRQPAVRDPAAGAQLPVTVPGDLLAPLERLAREREATLFTVLLASFLVLLERYTGSGDMVVGTPVAGRGRPELERLIGYFVNTVVLRCAVPAPGEDEEEAGGEAEVGQGGGIPFERFVDGVQQTVLAAFEHQELPFERLVEELAPRRDAGSSPLFDTLFVLGNAPRQTLELAGATLTPRRAGAGGAKFDLTLSLEAAAGGSEDQSSGGLGGFWEYSPELFDRTTIERLAGHWRALLVAVASAPGTPLTTLPLLTAGQRHQLTVEWNDLGLQRRVYLVGRQRLVAPLAGVGELWRSPGDGSPVPAADERAAQGWVPDVFGRDGTSWNSGTKAGWLQRTGRFLRYRPDGSLQPVAGEDEEPAAAAHRPPESDTERAVAALYGELLGEGAAGRQIAASDDFFALGGHSLLATRLAIRVRRAFGVEVPLAELFRAPTVEALARRIDDAAGEPAVSADDDGPPLVRAERDPGEPVPLSFAQARMWLLDRITPQPAAYHIAAAVELSGALRPAGLARALARIEERHEPLCARFVEADGEPGQRFAAPRRAAGLLPVVELAALPENRREAVLESLALAAARRPFDLAGAPPWRALLLRRSAGDHRLALTFHHAAADGWSLGRFTAELAALYSDPASPAVAERAPVLAPLAVRYGDYAAWQRRRLAEGWLDGELAWWRQQLSGASPALELPTDRPRPAVARHRGRRLAIRLPPPLTQAVHALAQRRSATPFMVLLAAFGALLSRTAGQPEVVIGSPVAGRSRPELDGLVGMFVNTLALRLPVAAAASFEALVDATRECVLAALSHQELPFERLVEAVEPQRDTARAPIFQVLFALQTAPPPVLELPALRLTPVDVDTGTAKLDLALELTPHRTSQGAALAGHWEYDRELFDATTARRLSRRLTALLAAALAQSSLPLGALSDLSAAERHQVSYEWNDSGAARGGEPVHRKALAQAAREPDRLAMLDGDRGWSYGALSAAARGLAARLRAAGVGPGERVALLLERSPELVVAMLAVLEAGAAYLPIDPAYPDARVDFLLADSRAHLLLTDAAGAERVGQRLRGATAVKILGDELAAAAATRARSMAPAADRFATQRLAYVIYTSGSTGRPKGVKVAHRGLTSLVAWLRERLDLRPGDRTVQLASPAFDATVIEIWPTLTAGACLCFAPESARASVEALADWLVERQVDTAFVPSALLGSLLECRWPANTRLRAAVTGGERITGRPSPDLPFAVHNLYGPTEATAVASAARVESDGLGAPSIGRPLPGGQCWVVSDPRYPSPAAIGAAGELWLTGDSLARGYLGRPARTAVTFVPDALSGLPGRRAYRTGDLVRWRANGKLEFLGRTDHQVKVRGFRIEPGEIEAALTQHPAVAEALVEARVAGPGDTRLAAWVVVAGDGAEELTPAVLAEHLRQRLPAYMVPAAITLLAALPLTAHGKIDRRALPAPVWGWRRDEADERLRGGIEETLAELWRGVLEVDGGEVGPIGPRDSFFDLGGHSLLAARLVGRVRETLGVELPLRELFEAPALRSMAERIEGERQADRPLPPPLVPLVDGAERPLSFAQERMWLLTQLAARAAAYHVPAALALDGMLHAAALARALAGVVERHETLRTVIAISPRGGAVARLVPPSPWRGQVPVVDLSGLGMPHGERAAGRLAVLEAAGRFDLTRGPLLRCRLLRLAPCRHRLLLTLHHFAADGWSVGILLHEVSALYGAAVAAQAPSLAPLPVQYADYAAWQRCWLAAGEEERQLGYWRRQLAALPVSSQLPADRPAGSVRARAAERLAGAGSLPFVLSAEELAAARTLARRHGATLFMALTAALAALLARYTGQRDLALGSPVANRTRAETEGLIGFFVNTLVLRVDLSQSPGFEALLAQVRDTVLDAFAHQELPFERLVEELAPERGLDRSPLFQVFLAVQNVPLGELALPGLALQPLPTPPPAVKFELSLTVVDNDGPTAQLSAIEYDADRYERVTVERFAEHLRRLLRAAVAQPAQPVSRLPLLSAAERHQLIREWGNGGALSRPADALGDSSAVAAGGLRAGDPFAAFEAWAALRPDAVALSCAGRVISYRALARRARRWGERLRAADAGAERVVAVSLERGPESVVALLACLAAGAVYLPLDPGLPPARRRQILDDARPVAWIVRGAVPDPAAAEPSAELGAGRQAAPHRLDPERDLAAWDAGPPADDSAGVEDAPLSAALRDTLRAGSRAAYVLYTSGSTGPPKGVVISAATLAAHLASAVAAYRLTAADRVLAFASFAFDVSIEQVLAPLVAGARLELRGEELWEPQRLAREAVARRVTWLNLPTAYWHGLVGDEPASEWLARGAVRLCLVGGEAMSPAAAERWASGPLAAVPLANGYGPTETAITATLEIWRPESAGEGRASVALGRPLPGRGAWVIDRDGQLAPPGAIGELWLGSGAADVSDVAAAVSVAPMVARGYLGDPRRTAERFVPDALSGRRGARLYRSGDLVRLGAGGGLEFLGRRDQQVKIRGFRVEPGAIEAALIAQPQVRAAAVVARPDAGGTMALVAYVVLGSPAGGAPEAGPPAEGSGERLLAALAERLPSYAQPAAIVPLTALPLTERGKLDRAALPAPRWERRASRPPRTPLERSIAAVWGQVLGLPAVGAGDDFFALGGHSLAAMRAIARLRHDTGREVDLRQMFATPTVAGLAAALEDATLEGATLEEDGPATGAARAAAEIVPRAGAGEAVLSFAQERLWFLHRLDPDSPVYNIPTALRMSGRLEVAALARSLGEVVARHQVLRTQIEEVDGQPRARVAPAARRWPLPVVDLSGLAGAGGDWRRQALPVARLARREARRPFDLARDPMLRAALLRTASVATASAEHVLLLTVHHIASDGASTPILVDEIERLYPAFSSAAASPTAASPAGVSPLPPLAVQYSDFAAWQRTRLEGGELKGGELERQLAYWRGQLAELPPGLELPTDRPRPRRPTQAGGELSVDLPAELVDRLTARCRAQGATLFMGFLAAWAALLARWCGHRDLAIGSPVANRDRAETESLIGFFVNTLVLRADLGGGIDFDRLLAQVRETVLDAFAHQELPFEALVGELAPRRDLDRPPLFQTMLTVDTAAARPVRLPGLELTALGGDGGGGDGGGDLGMAKFELMLTLAPRTGGGWRGYFEYRRELFEATTIRRLAGWLRELVAAAVAAPQRPVLELPLLSAAQRQQSLVEWNDTAATKPAATEPAATGAASQPAADLWRLFTACAERTPQAIALATAHGEQLSYGALLRRARRLAGALAEAGVEPGERVAVCLDRGWELVVSLLATAARGAAYVPLAPDQPAARIEAMLAAARPRVVLARPGWPEMLAAAVAAVAAVATAAQGRGGARIQLLAPSALLAASATVARHRCDGPPHPQAAAYVLFTSGSTGTPKGAVISHAAAVNHMRWMARRFAFGTADRVLQKTPISFDASGWEFWVPLTAGCRLELAAVDAEKDPRALALEIERTGATIVQVVPSLLELLVDEPRFAAGRSLRTVFCGGEPLTAALSDRFLATLPAALINLYGPTEVTIDATFHRCVPAAAGEPAATVVSLGRPIRALRAHVLDPALGWALTGAVGELCLAGAGVGAGYLGQPARTAAAFVPDPDGREPGDRIYKTGDLVRRAQGGELEFVGRRDFQLKVRGLRIEPGEVEAALLAHPSVQAAVVVAQRPADGDVRLVGYWVPTTAGRRAAEAPLSESRLREFLAERLPTYMVPSALVELERLPRTRHGKIDRAALPAPEWSARRGGHVAPRTPAEELVAGVFAAVLGSGAGDAGGAGGAGEVGAGEVGADDDFFALGGHSLQATRVASRLREATGLEVPVRRLFESPTVAGLAAWLHQQRSAGQPPEDGVAVAAIETLPRDGDGLPLELPPLSFAQERMWLLDSLAEGGGSAYVIPSLLRLAGGLRPGLLARALAAVVARHETLRTRYVLASDDLPRQQVTPPPPWRTLLPVVDLSALGSPAARRHGAERWVRHHHARPFDLDRGPIFRALLLRLGEDEHLLSLTAHHIATDGWSSAILLHDLTAAYRALHQSRPAAADWEPLAVHYCDFAAWQRQRLSGERLERWTAHWHRQLDGAPRQLDLPTDRPRPAVQSERGALLPLALAPSLADALAGFGNRRGLTLFMTLLAAYGALLARYCGVEELLIGSPIAGRDRRELEGIVGLFVNSLVLRVRPRGEESFAELCATVRETALLAYAHQELPFERLVDALITERSLSRPPLFQVSLALHNAPPASLTLPEVDIERVESEATTAKFELSLVLARQDGILTGGFEYNRDLFDRTTVERLSGSLQTLLAAALAAPERPLGELAWLPAAQRHQLLFEQGRGLPLAASPADPVAGFEAWAQAAPAAVALVTGGGCLSYGELDRRAEWLAAHLRAHGVTAETVVAVRLPRGPAALVALLAVLKAGGAYLPVDPELPAARQAWLLDDAAPAVVLTAQAPPNGPVAGLRWIELDEAGRLPVAGDASAETDPPAAGEPSARWRLRDPQRLAYLLYTSGSTGQPKGVEMGAAALARHLAGASERYRLSAGERVLQFAAFSFDVSLEQMLAPLSCGASLVLRGDEPWEPQRTVREVIAHRVTVLNLPTAYWQALVLDAELAAELATAPPRRLLVGGEAMPGTALAAWLDGPLGELPLLNVYGPTEAAMTATAHRVQPADAALSAVPLGLPLPGRCALVADPAGRWLPAGAAGELWLGEAGLARGYRGQAARTAEAFRPDPRSPRPGGRLYRTGDRVRRRGDGALEFLGRLDDQLKLRGYRIEPGEIEAALLAHPEVAEAAVVLVAPAAPDGAAAADHEPLLAAALARTARDAEPAPPATWRRHLAERLPAYMLPARFLELPALPKTASGKIDRPALAVLLAARLAAAPASRRAALAPPGNELERRIAALLAEVLGVEQVGVRENFFELGAHSLMLARVRTRLVRELGRELPLVDLFRFPTVEGLARHLTAAPGAAPAGAGAAGEPAPAAARRPVEAPAARSAAGAGDIAVVGMSGRFPGAGSVAELWRELCAGSDLVTRFSDEELLAAGVDPQLVADPRFVRSVGTIRDFDRFDAGLFRIPPQEAAVLDPQQRLFLECAWEALENAACDPSRFGGPIGIFGGVSMSQYWSHLLAAGSVDGLQMSLANDKDFAVTRVAYKLGLTGPGVSVQTACSTSLVAVHLARRALLAGECDLALAGGVSVRTYEATGYLHEPGGINSPDGVSRTFDAAAQGTVPSNGAAVVVLKRLEDAVADGDVVHAVIKGSAVTNDGAGRAGFSAPSVAGQQAAIEAALASGGIEPETVRFIEAHGTATPVGDPIEVTALRGSYDRQAGDGASSAPPLAIGSIKTNLGHMDAAAGAGSLIKAVLALEHRTLPPSLHFETPNPALGLEGSRLYVASRLEPLAAAAPDVPLRAGVSSFGLGGTNAHVVLEEAPPRPPSGPSRRWQLLTLSAASETALAAAGERLAAYLEHSPQVPLADVAHTLAVGRRALRHRRVLVAENAEEARRMLLSPDGTPPLAPMPATADETRPVFVLLPAAGVPAAAVAALEAAEPGFRDSLERCRTVLAQREEPVPAERQAAIERFCGQFALARFWVDWGLTPEGYAGGGVGEVVVGCLAGVFDLEAALALLASGRLPAAAQLRAPALPVRCGERGDWLDAERAADPEYWRRRLAAQADDAGQRRLELAGLDADERRILLVMATAEAITTGSGVGAAGPARVLASLPAGATAASPVDPQAWLLAVFGRLWVDGAELDPALLSDGEQRYRLELPTYPFERQRYWVDKPVHTLEQMAGRLQAGGELRPEVAVPVATPRADDPADWFYLPSWRPALPAPADGAGDGDPADWVLLADAGGLAEAVAERLRAGGHRCWWVHPGEDYAALGDDGWRLDPQRAEHYDRLLGDLAARGAPGRRFACFWALDSWTERDPLLRWQRWLERGLYTAAFLAAAQVRAGLPQAGSTLVLLSAGAHAVGGGERPRPAMATATGALAALTAEHPSLACRAIDLAPRPLSLADGEETAALAMQVAAELRAGDGPPVVALRDGRRWLPSFTQTLVAALPPEEPALPAGAVCWLTAGLSPFGLALASHLVERHGARLLLTQATELPPESEWPRLLAQTDSEAADHGAERHLLEEAAAAIRGLSALRERGEVEVVTNTPEGDGPAMAAALARAERRFGPVQALFHLAGDGPIGFPVPVTDLTPSACSAVFAVKARGVEVLDELLAGRDLEMALLFAPSERATAHPGKAAEGAAAAYVAARVEAMSSQRWRAGRQPWTAVRWDGWPAATAHTATGDHAFSAAEALQAVERTMALCRRAAVASVTLSPTDPATRVVADATAPSATVRRPLVLAPRPNLPIAYHPPQGALERQVAGFWQELLGIEGIGRFDHFLDLGGDSLLGLRLLSRLREVLGVELTVADLFEQPTIADLAEMIARHSATETAAAAEPVAAVGEVEDLVAVAGDDVASLEALLASVESLSEEEVEAEFMKREHENDD